MKEYGPLPGFTPVIDSAASTVGWTAASVLGVIYRYSHMDDGYCWASQENIGKRINKSRTTVNIAIKDLIEAGYLIDLTPSVKGSTHSYIPSYLMFLSVDDHADVESSYENIQQGLLEELTATCKDLLHKDTYKDTKKRISPLSSKNHQTSAEEGRILFNLEEELQYMDEEVKSIIEKTIQLWDIKPEEKNIDEWIADALLISDLAYDFPLEEVMDEVYEESKGDLMQPYSSLRNLMRTILEVIKRKHLSA